MDLQRLVLGEPVEDQGLCSVCLVRVRMAVVAEDRACFDEQVFLFVSLLILLEGEFG